MLDTPIYIIFFNEWLKLTNCYTWREEAQYRKRWPCIKMMNDRDFKRVVFLLQVKEVYLYTFSPQKSFKVFVTGYIPVVRFVITET